MPAVPIGAIHPYIVGDGRSLSIVPTRSRAALRFNAISKYRLRRHATPNKLGRPRHSVHAATSTRWKNSSTPPHPTGSTPTSAISLRADSPSPQQPSKAFEKAGSKCSTSRQDYHPPRQQAFVDSRPAVERLTEVGGRTSKEPAAARADGHLHITARRTMINGRTPATDYHLPRRPAPRPAPPCRLASKSAPSVPRLFIGMLARLDNGDARRRLRGTPPRDTWIAVATLSALCITCCLRPNPRTRKSCWPYISFFVLSALSFRADHATGLMQYEFRRRWKLVGRT